ncbi:hypothetical protein AB0J68_27170, partial [Micromonospora sp. NPDC049580]|uniref:hypothetical protein n=1 Tax=Micromonospora sp. NPDC049580 TaxID=3154832 RepID=UPI003427FBCF
ASRSRPRAVMDVTHLVEACWDDAGPWAVRKQVQNQVGALRLRERLLCDQVSAWQPNSASS